MPFETLLDYIDPDMVEIISEAEVLIDQQKDGQDIGEELSEEQIKSLGKLYNKQITNLRKSNE